MKNKNKNEYTVLDADRPTHLNAKLMRLLILVPEFQKEIHNLRGDPKFSVTEAQIKECSSDDRTTADDMMTISEWFKKRGYLLFNHYHYIKTNDPFFQEIQRIGKKFNLPENFYNDALWGIPCYAITGRITILNNFSGNESKFWQSYFNKARARIREFEKKFPLVEKLLTRKEKPRKVKKFNDYYLQLTYSKLNRDQMAEWKRIGKWKYSTNYSEQPASLIAKRAGITGANLRTFQKELNQLAKKLFGYGILREK